MKNIRFPLATAGPVLFALIMAAAFAAVGMVSSRLGEQNIRQSIRAFSRPIVQSSARALFDPLDEKNAAQASVILSQYVDGRTVVYAATYNDKGRKIAETLRGWTPGEDLGGTLALQAFTGNAPVEWEKGDFLVLSSPISAGGQTLGAVVFAFDQRELRASFSSNRDTILFYSLLITFLASLFTFVVIRFALRPLSKLTAAAKRIGAGQLESPVSAEGVYEFASLAESIEAMRVELAKNYKNLQQVLTGLEQRVAERTAAAESARTEAESARERLEEEVWLAKGQTCIADAMRGEQVVSQLAQNIISRLCAYMQVESGALFVLDGDALSLKGRYAVAERAGLAERTLLGEGLVGQAAADGEPLVWSFPETGARVISTGLADFKPRSVMAFPFFANGKIIGVVELAALSDFEERHFELLRRLSETIGMGFVTSQTRQRLMSALADKD